MGFRAPKRKKSRSRTRHRKAANMRTNAPTVATCPQCKQAKLPHVVCPHCGWYKDRTVINVADT